MLDDFIFEGPIDIHNRHALGIIMSKRKLPESIPAAVLPETTSLESPLSSTPGAAIDIRAPVAKKSAPVVGGAAADPIDSEEHQALQMAALQSPNKRTIPKGSPADKAIEQSPASPESSVQPCKKFLVLID